MELIIIIEHIVTHFITIFNFLFSMLSIYSYGMYLFISFYSCYFFLKIFEISGIHPASLISESEESR